MRQYTSISGPALRIFFCMWSSVKKVWTPLFYIISVMIFFTAKNPNQPLHIVYVPSHLYHMLFELFKVQYPSSLTNSVLSANTCLLSHYIIHYFLWQNAMRATVETHETSITLPPIKVRVSLGSEDLTIKVDVDPDSEGRLHYCTKDSNQGENPV